MAKAGWFLGLGLLLGGVSIEGAHYAAAQGVTPIILTNVRVVDGDTIDGNSDRWRIADFDTPEPMKQNARCPAEMDAGKRATEHLRKLVDGAVVTAVITQRSRDRDGRRVANVWINGRDLRELMIADGFGARWNYGKEPKPNWCRR